MPVQGIVYAQIERLGVLAEKVDEASKVETYIWRHGIIVDRGEITELPISRAPDRHCFIFTGCYRSPMTGLVGEERTESDFFPVVFFQNKAHPGVEDMPPVEF